MADAAWVGDPPIRVTRWVPPDHVPHAPQHAFLALEEVFEMLYGGAAGGGKSDALLWAALQYVDVPGYAALLLRRTFPDLNQPGALIPRSKEWLAGGDVRWNENEHRWTFPSGSTITFGHMQHEDDKLRYQSTEFQFIGFDELTQFTETQFTYMASRLRRPTAGPLSQVPLRLRGASNPGGPGHRWVKRRLIDRQPDEQDPEDTPEKCARRVFIPAKLSDNPSIDQDAYLRSLSALDAQTRQQLLEGDWNARPPGEWVFPRHLDQVLALGALHDQLRRDGRMPPPVDGSLILCADWGLNSHLLLLWPLEAGGFYVVREFVYEGNAVRKIAEPVAAAIQDLGFPVYRERFDASMPGLNEAFLEALGDHIRRPKYVAVPFNRFKAMTVLYLRDLVANVGAGFEEHRSVGHWLRFPPPLLSVSPTGCPVLAEQLRGWAYADPDLGRIEKGDDHGPDALVAGAAPEASKRRRLKPPIERTAPV